MLKEVHSAVDFVVHILSLGGTISAYEMEKFSQLLESLLFTKFERHWFPQKPYQGSAYRCIRITQLQMDSDISKAAELSGISLPDICRLLPQELTLWIDPEDVSYRIGEDGSICQLIPSEEDSETSESSSSSSPLQDSSIFLNQSCHSEVPRPSLVEPTNVSPYTQCWS